MARGKFIIVIGTSAGGTVALPELLRQLTDKMDVSVFVVMHLTKKSIGDLVVNRLQKHTSLICKVAANNESIQKRHLYLAMADHHLMVKKNKMLVGRGPMENRYRPSIDALFRSAAVAFGPQVIGIVLTGMLEDGVAGMIAIKKCQGVCIIQEPDEAKYPDMPKAVLNALQPDFQLPIEAMGEAIANVIKRRKSNQSFTIPKEILREAEIAERVHIGIDVVEQLGKDSPYSCPDCGGGLWEIEENGMTRYRCHVGHAFTQMGLLTNMQSSTEAALWTALRILEERKNLLHKIGTKEKETGSVNAATSYFRRAQELEDQINHLKNVLFLAIADEPHNGNGKRAK
jgi:two-component system chemotaxis response regulator CheB